MTLINSITATTYALLSMQLQSNKVCAMFMHIKENEPNREWLHLAKRGKTHCKRMAIQIHLHVINMSSGFMSSVLIKNFLIYLFDPEDFSNLFMVVIR